MLNFWDRMWIVHMNMVKDYYNEREKQKLKWKEFCNDCVKEIINKTISIINVIKEATSKQSGAYIDNDLYSGIIQLPLYGFYIVLQDQIKPSEDQERLLEAYFSSLNTGFNKKDFILAAVENNNVREELINRCGISDKEAGEFWVQFFKVLYRTDNDYTYVEKVINAFCRITIQFAAMNRKFDDTYILRTLKGFINSVNVQSVICRDIPKDKVDFYGDSTFVEHFNAFKTSVFKVLDYTIEEPTEEMNANTVFEQFVIGVIYQIVRRCHADRAEKIKMVDDVLAQIDVGTTVNGKYVFKYLEDLQGEDTSMLGAMARIFTDVENNPVGWILISRLSGTYSYDKNMPVHTLLEANNFVVGMDNYLNKKYPMRGFGRIGVDYCKEVANAIAMDAQGNDEE